MILTQADVIREALDLPAQHNPVYGLVEHVSYKFGVERRVAFDLVREVAGTQIRVEWIVTRSEIAGKWALCRGGPDNSIRKRGR